MISIVLYGRNDSYGYNLHKRAALSLNCMAEVLTDPDDEILFVDYNTPDDYPTFPEAIADTLTERARRMIRIFRVRPDVHQRLYASRTHLKALEPVSRNVAVRRSNPANRWILSTNTDMIFVPRHGNSLTDLMAPLGGGFYCAPRMEIPETLWEDFDRQDAAGVIKLVRRFGSDLHLNEIVRGSDNILYDGPGDFQLIRRADLFRIDGFHDDMVLGWHVDSNISRRLMLLHGKIDDAAPFVFGYHCDHTRQVTPAHAYHSKSNDSTIFVDGVTAADVPQQRQTWGLPGEQVEEIRLGDAVGRRYLHALQAAISKPLVGPIESAYRADSYNQEPASPEHVLPFLLDLFASGRRDMRLTWLGVRDGLFQLFSQCWFQLGFTELINVSGNGGDSTSALAAADVIVVNFGVPLICSGLAEELVVEEYWAAIYSEARRQADGRPPRRIIAVNAIHNRFESLVQTHLSCAKTPFSARLRHGYLIPQAMSFPLEWMENMLPGSAGRKDGRAIVSSGVKGHVAYGPYFSLPIGVFRAKVLVTVVEPNSVSWIELFRPPKEAALTLEIVVDEAVQASTEFMLQLGQHELSMPVHIARADTNRQIQIRLTNRNACYICLERVSVEI